MLNKNTFTCDFEGCGKYLDSPVTLPCGYTICLEHIKHLSYFDCSMCKSEHISFDENGFRINSKLDEIIKYNIHLDGKHKEVKDLFDKLQSNVNEFKISKIADPDTFIYDYFADLRNQIDLHRDEMIQEINKKSEQILRELNDLETEMKTNLKKMEIINLSDFYQENSRQILREPDLNSDKLISLQNDFVIKISEFENKRNWFEIELKMNRDIEFIKSDDKSFGLIKYNSLKEIGFIDLTTFKKSDEINTELNPESNQTDLNSSS
jgi:hypothetical protein